MFTEFIRVLSSFNIKPVIHKASRLQNCLDNFLINFDNFYSDVLDYPISVHNIISLNVILASYSANQMQLSLLIQNFKPFITFTN